MLSHKKSLFLAGVALCLHLAGFAQRPKTSWTSLFNGKDLSGWESYLDKPAKTSEVAGLARNASGDYTEPLGLNQDPNHVFTVVRVDGAPAIRISGETFGGINTLQEFENYHLRLEFKWGEKKWPPKLDQRRDSGLLYHSVGPHGTPMLWMESHELQIQEADCGDYWGVMNVLADIPARKKEAGKFVYEKGAPPVTFQDKTPNGRTCVKIPDAENPSGQWNTVELYCFGDTCIHVVNGVVNLMLFHSQHLVGGVAAPLTKGKIQLQSEGAEVFYRNIEIQSIRALPPALLR